MKFILHIGLPKTGTKYLQTHFRRHYNLLAAAGVHYPRNWWVSKYDSNHDGLARDLIAKNDARLAPIFAEFEASEYTSILLSCEGFSDFREADLSYLKSLIGSAEVQVVFFCRRWSDWMPSAWQQTVKQGSHLTFPEFMAVQISEARVIPAINFRIILDAYEKLFGRDAIAIVPYSNLLDQSFDIVAAFYRHFLGFEEMPSITRETIHPSIGIDNAEVVRALNSLTVRSGRSPDFSTFQRMEMFVDDEIVAGPLSRINAAMKESVGEINVGDFAEPFHSLFEELTRDYGDLVRDVGCGTQLFTQRDAPLQFIRQDYMLFPGVVEDILMLQARLASISAAEDAAKAETTVFSMPTDPPWYFDMQVMQGEAAVDFLAAHPMMPAAADCDQVAFPTNLSEGTVPPGLLVEGWSSPEPTATWTDGKRAVMKVMLDATGGDQCLYLILRPFIAPPELPAQRFTLSINGQAVGRNRISQFSVIRVSFPWVLLDDARAVTLTFELPDAARPSDLTDLVQDDRQLGLSFEHVSIWPDIGTQSPSTAIELPRDDLIESEAGRDPSDGVLSIHEHPVNSGVQASQRASGDEPASSPQLDLELALADLVVRFESLGENCEFGLVQRQCGAEPIGLFRFSSAPLPRLLKALRAKFKGMGRPGNIVVEESSNGREYMVQDKAFGFLYHAWVLVGEMEPADVARRESRRLPLLVRKLVEDLTNGEKIFVYHGMDPLSSSEGKELASALQAYGPATLLWVELADEVHAAGTVEQLEPGLLKGYMDRFAPGENAHDLSLDCWVSVCRNAYRIWKTQEPATEKTA